MVSWAALPSGLCSRGRVRRRLRVGHAGTLDAAAAGVLVVALGHACSLLAGPSTLSGRKRHRTTICLGRTTTTLDPAGYWMPDSNDHGAAAARSHDRTAETVSWAVRELLGAGGPHRQTPPTFSARKLKGAPHFRRAHLLCAQLGAPHPNPAWAQATPPHLYPVAHLRDQGYLALDPGAVDLGQLPVVPDPLRPPGTPVPVGPTVSPALAEALAQISQYIPAKIVQLDAAAIVGAQDPWDDLDLVTGPGSYVRSLAADLGAKLHTTACCHSSTRVRQDPFAFKDCLVLTAATTAQHLLAAMAHTHTQLIPDARLDPRPFQEHFS